MAPTPHLRALQALELAIRHGSMQDAARELSITPAAVGQRIRALEDYLGTDLLLRGRSGLRPTPMVEHALSDLRAGFAALERAAQNLDFQRVFEIHVVADPEWSELWLKSRLATFREAHPSILFCLNGEGDVPVRLGAPDLRIERSADPTGKELFRDAYLPVCSPANIHRIGNWDEALELEGMPLLHVDVQSGGDEVPGWRQWISRYGLRREGVERGVHYRRMRPALDAARNDVGFLICGLALAREDIESGRILTVYPLARNLPAPDPYRMILREAGRASPQLRKFCDWLEEQARETRLWIETCISGA